MSNLEIINQEASKKGFVYTGDNLFTFPEWHSQGYSIIKGQRAFITTKLWSNGINKRLKTAIMFRADQVRKNEVKSLILV